MFDVNARQDTIVSVVTNLQVGQSGIQFLVGAKVLASLLQNIQTSSGAHPAPYWLGSVVFFWVMQPGYEVAFLPPSSVEVKNKWSCTFAAPIISS
jgi:hypothetical protein